MTTAAAAPTSRRLDTGVGVLEGLTAPWFILVGALLLVARRPESLLRAEFNWEEANAFYVPTFFFDPLSLLVEPWGGTLQVVTRIGYQALRAVPTAWAPLAENILAMAAILAVATFIASNRLAGVIPDRRLRVTFGLLLLVLPAQWAVLGTFVNAQWYGAVWLALVPLATVPQAGRGRSIERGAALLVGLTGPFSTLFAPIYLWRLRRDRGSQALWLAGIVTVTGLVQLLTAVAAGRADATGDRSILFGTMTFLLHAAIVPVIGERLAAAVGVVGIPSGVLFAGGVALMAGLVAVAARVVPARFGPYVFAALVVAASGIAVHRGNGIWPPGANERYFLLVALLVAAAVVTGAARRMPLGVALAALLAVGVAVDFRLAPYPSQDWAAHVACIGSANSCTVPIWPHDYDVHWPGTGETYELPAHHDP